MPAPAGLTSSALAWASTWRIARAAAAVVRGPGEAQENTVRLTTGGRRAPRRRPAPSSTLGSSSAPSARSDRPCRRDLRPAGCPCAAPPTPSPRETGPLRHSAADLAGRLPRDPSATRGLRSVSSAIRPLPRRRPSPIAHLARAQPQFSAPASAPTWRRIVPQACGGSRAPHPRVTRNWRRDASPQRSSRRAPPTPTMIRQPAHPSARRPEVSACNSPNSPSAPPRVRAPPRALRERASACDATGRATRVSCELVPPRACARQWPRHV